MSENPRLNRVRVKLIGVLGSAAGRPEIDLESPKPQTISELLETLIKTVNNRQFQDFLMDSGTHDPRPNVIILLNDQDCNLFNGLRTEVENGATVVIIPVAHGG